MPALPLPLSPFRARARSAGVAALASLAALALATPAAGSDGGADVELPRGFQLDLASGLVKSRLPEGAAGLTYRAGRLESPAPLYRPLPASEGPRPRIERGVGEAVGDLDPRVGSELVYDLGAAGWGYLRVLSVHPERVRLERAHAPEGARLIERQPRSLSVRAVQEGLELSWPAPGAAAGGATLRVERRFLPRHPGDPDPGFELLDEVAGSAFLDRGAHPTRVAEYRVRLHRTEAGLGSRARGVPGLWGPDRPISLFRGMELSLLSGREDPGRVDLRVQHAGENGAQLAPGPGVSLRTLSQVEEGAWRLPELAVGEWSSAAVFAAPGRTLAAHLPEGVYARLLVERGPGGELRLLRQIDLSGGRTFPPPPPAPRATWDAARGLVLVVEGLPGAPEPGPAQAELAVEVEDGFETGVWTALEGQPLVRELVLGDRLPAGLTRLRLRYRMAGGELSLASPAALALVGDDGGEGAERLLERSIAELASDDYATRRRAQGTLEALGARGAARLRGALGSDDPELAAAARDVLGRIGAEHGGGEGAQATLAPIVLRARADARGLAGEPPAGWFDPLPSRRALAVLRHLCGQPAGHLESWRELAAADDPDPRVRRLASLAPSLAPPPATPGWIERLLAEGPDPRVPPAPWRRLLGPGVGAVELARALVAGAGSDADPWSELARLAALHGLGRTLDEGGGVEWGGVEWGGGREESARLDAQLVLGLLERNAAGADPAFVEAARRVVEHPAARLAAARSLADRRLAPAALEGPREVRELDEPTGDALAAVLEELERGPRDDLRLDLRLPPGVYEPGTSGGMLRTSVRGLRLVGQGQAVLAIPLYVGPGGELTLEGLRLAPPTGIALTVARGAVLLRDCVVVPAQLGLHVSDGRVALLRTEIAREGASATTAGIRAGGDTLVLVRDSLIDADGGALAGARLALIERSVLLSASGTALAGTRDGEAWVIDSLIAGGSVAVSGLSAGLLEGALLAADSQVAAQLGPNVLACPDHLLLQGPAGALGERPAARACPLGR